MSEAPPTQGAGKRRPQEADLEPLLALVAEGSLTAACKKLGLDTPSTFHWIHDDPTRRQRYDASVRAREDLISEEGLIITKAAALGMQYEGKAIDPAGARVYLDALKWMSGRMRPKVHHVDLNITSDPDARKGRIAALLKKAAGEESEEQADG